MVAIALLLLSNVLWFLAGFAVGWHFARIQRYLVRLQQAIVNLRKAQPEPPKRPSATIIDPEDVAQRAKFEADEMRRRLNQ